MQTAFIYPPALKYLMGEQNYHLVLAHLFQHQTYRDLHRDLTGYKILDNGAAEGETITGRELIEIAWTWEVNEVVVPDEPGDWHTTVERAEAFQKHVVSDFKYVGVVQGPKMDQAIACITALARLDYITILALPRSLCSDDRMDRYYLASVLPEYTGGRFEAIHCLGSSWWLREAVALSELPMIRGIDTSMPIKMGLEGHDIATSAEHYNTMPTNLQYFNIQEVDVVQEELIVRNITTYRQWAASSPTFPL